MTLSEAIATRIEELMEEKKITQYRLSMNSGVSQTSINEMRNQKYKAPNLYLIYELCEGFGIGLKDFFASPLFENGEIID